MQKKKTSNSMALFDLFLIFFPPPLLVSTSHCRRDLITCLIYGGVTNFTSPNRAPLQPPPIPACQATQYQVVQPRRRRLAGKRDPGGRRPVLPAPPLRHQPPRRRAQLLGTLLPRPLPPLRPRQPRQPQPRLPRRRLQHGLGRQWHHPRRALLLPRHLTPPRRGFPAGMCPTVGVVGHFSGSGYVELARNVSRPTTWWTCGWWTAAAAYLTGGRWGRACSGRSAEEAEAVGAVVGWKMEVPERVTVFRVVKSGRSAMVAKLWEKWQVVASSAVDDDLFVQGLVFGGGGGSTGAVSLMFMGMNLQPKLPTLAAMAVFFPELNVTQQDCKEL